MSPVFLTMVLLSLVLWYLTKLSYTYTAQVPIEVEIEGNNFTVDCIAEGTGYKIVSYRFFHKGDIRLSLHDVQTTPSAMGNGSLDQGRSGRRFTVNASSLQNAMSARISDIQIISVGEIPEISIPAPGSVNDK